MNKDMISLGLRKLTAMITENKGYDCVYVPRRGKKPCTWSTTNKSYACISFSVLHDVVTFVLNNTYVKDFDGNLWRQDKGIPMGDPHSPGMCIGACAWMEHEWMQTLTPQVKDHMLIA